MSNNTYTDRCSSPAVPPPPMQPPAPIGERAIFEPVTPTTVTEPMPVGPPTPTTVTTPITEPTPVEPPAPTPTSPRILDETYREREAIALYSRYIEPAIGAAMATPGTPRQRVDEAMCSIRRATGWRRLQRGQDLRAILMPRVVEAAARQERHRAIRSTLPRAMKPLSARLRDGEVPEHRKQKAAWAAFWRWVAEQMRARANGGQ